MDPQHRLQLANRIQAELMRELGQGIDVRQLLDSPLYARDVLLVCQAYPDTELQQLGQRFQLASVPARPTPALRAGARPAHSSGFGVSKPAASVAFSDFDSFIDSAHEVRQTSRRWLAPSTWFAR